MFACVPHAFRRLGLRTAVQLRSMATVKHRHDVGSNPDKEASANSKHT